MRSFFTPGNRRCRHEPLFDNLPPPLRHAPADEGIAGVERRDGVEGHLVQVLRRDGQFFRKLLQGVDRDGANIRCVQRLPCHGGEPVEAPATPVVIGLNPALNAGLAAKVDAALSLGIAGVRDDHTLKLPNGSRDTMRTAQSVSIAKQRDLFPSAPVAS